MGILWGAWVCKTIARTKKVVSIVTDWVCLKVPNWGAHDCMLLADEKGVLDDQMIIYWLRTCVRTTFECLMDTLLDYRIWHRKSQACITYICMYFYYS